MIKQENFNTEYFEAMLRIKREHEKSVDVLCADHKAMLRAVEILTRRSYIALSVKPVSIRQYGYKRFRIKIEYGGTK